MVRYRRNRVPGGTYFFTVTLRDRRSKVLVDHIDLLRASIHVVRKERPFSIGAVVVLPDHLHMLWTLPPSDDDFSGRWRAIKSKFTHMLVRHGVALQRNIKGEYDLWQRRFWEHTIRDDVDYERHMDYIHFNPVKHGLVTRVVDWPYSSFHRYVQLGLLDTDWGGNPEDLGKNGFGE